MNGATTRALVPPWIAVSFENSWANYGGGYQEAAYYRGQDMVVHLRGVINSGTTGATAFTLPAGYRPPASCIFAVASNGAFGVVDITAAGAVSMTSVNNTYVSLDSISFRTV